MTESSNSSPTLNFFVTENELGNIDLYGSVVGIADGEVINFLLTDDDGNSKTVSAVITGGEFSLSNVWAGMFGEGLVNVVATAGGIEGTGEVELSGTQLQAPVTLTSNVLDANLRIDVQGQAPGLEPGTVLTLVIRDEQNNEVTAEAEVMADGSFSVQDIDTLGLSEGVLRFDVFAQDANGVLNLPNIASLVLTGNGPQGADNTLNATEDTAYVVNAAAFGYDSSQGHTLTGIKITSLPAQGTLKLNGNVVQVDDVISKADIDAGKLTYQGALNGNGSNYASFLFKVQDSRDTNNEDTTANKLTFNVTAVNDAAIISGPVTGAVTEAGGVNNATAGSPSATGTLTSTDVDGTPNAFTAVTTAAASTGGYGTYTMTAGGQWAYTLNNANTTVQALKAAQTLTDTFTVTAADGTPRVVTVTITGSNDAATISGTTTGSVTEAGSDANGNAIAGTPGASGTLTSTDVDGTANAFTAVSTPTTTTNGYGSYTMTAAGAWAYTVNNANAAVQALKGSQTLTDTFNVTAADGTVQTVTVTINGANDAAQIGGTKTGSVTEAGGVNNGTAGNPNATGTLTSTDVDGTANAFTAVSTAATTVGGYGTYTMTAAGVWAYTLDNTNTAVQALTGSQTLTDTFNVTAADGTIQTVTVTINGTNDAAVISGPVTGAVTEAGGVNNATAGSPSATGTLTSTDVDGTPNAFTAVTTAAASTGGYGTYTMTAGGQWAYTLNNANTTVQALKAAQTLTDTFTVTAADGTPRVVTVTITGSNDAATISGTTTGSVTEAGSDANGNAIAGTPGASGTLTSTDVDGTANAFTAVSTPTTTTNGYGSYTMTAAGAWAYTVNNANAAVQALKGSQTLTDTFNVTAADGTVQTVTVTINGANDAAQIGGTKTGSVTEAGGVNNGTAGNPNATGTLTSTDVDGTANAFTAVSTAATTVGGYGTYTMTAAGVWAYTLDNTNTAVQALTGSQTLTDTFNVTAADGTIQTVTVTINGTNDAAVISGPVTGAVTEAGGVNNATAGSPSATGTLTSTDVDGTPNAFTAVTTAAASTGGYGTYTMTAGGQWAYTLNNANTTVQALKAAQTLTDTFTVTAADGTAKVVTVTITGSNDAATISGTTTGSVTEAGSDANGNAIAGTPGASGTLTSTDVDGTANAFTAVSTPTTTTNGYGSYTMTAAGAWAYTVNNANAAVQALKGSQTLTDTFNVTAADGTVQTVTVTINGANDAATFTGDITKAITETNAAQSVTGTLTVADMDSATTVVAQTAVNGSAGYGKFTISTTGAWSYAMNTAQNQFVAGQTYDDTLTVTTADGTQQVIKVTITGTNDAPVLANTTLNMAAVLQDSGVTPVGAVGMLVSNLVGGVTDADTGAAKGIAITGFDSAKGQLYFSTNGGADWTEIFSVSEGSARLLAADADNRVYFRAATGIKGAVDNSLTFRAWDGTTGTDGLTGNASVNDGTTAFSKDSDNVSSYVVAPVTINAVSTDDLVNVREPLLITGKADPNAVVTLNINSQNFNVTANATGDWSYDGSKVRYVMVRKSLMNLPTTDPDYNLKGILTIGEVEIFQRTTNTNLSTLPGVSQSYSNVNTFTTGSLLDMNAYYTAGSYVETSGSQMGLATGVSQDAWVQIDLGAAYSLNDIKLMGAQNTSARLNGATIYTSATDMSALTKAQLDSSVLVNKGTPVTGLTNAGWQGYWASSDSPDAIYGNALNEGPNTITATELVQGVSSQATRVVTLDTIAPVTTVTSAALSSDTGTSNTDFVTSVAAQIITGNLSANLATGEKVMVSLDNGVTWVAATATVGTSTWSLPGVTLSGSSTLQAKVVDTAGNGSTPYTKTYAYVPVSDLTVGITLIEDNAGTATNVLSGGTSNDTTPTLVGTLGGATQGAALGTNEVVNVYRTPNLATATVVNHGSLAGEQILSGNPLTHLFVGDGNYGPSGNVYLPTTPGNGHMVVITKTANWGISVYNGSTLVGNVGTAGVPSGGQDNLYFKWDAAQGQWLTGTNALTKVGAAVVTTNATGQSIWTLTDNTGLGNSDSLNYIAQVENTAGTFGKQSTPGALDWRYNVDNVAPSSISLIGTDDVGPVTGPMAANGVTNDDKPTFSGSTEANAVVSVYDGTTLLGTTTANGSGAWSFTPTTALATGAHSVTAKATDASGNTSTASTALAFSVDTGTPTAVADVKNSDEDTTPITGSVATNDTNKDGSESYAIVGSAAGTYGTLTMNANGTYSYARSVVLDNIQTTAVETFTYKVTDAAGNTTQSTLTINMAPVNDAAVIAGDLLKTVSETNAAQTVTGALSITDVDSAQTFNALTGVVGTYGSFSMTTAGAWTYVMSAAQDQFKAGVAYTDLFTVSSADGTSKIVTVTINGTNDGPVLVSTNQAFSDFFENGGAVSAKKGSIQLSDIDSDNFQGATVSVIDFVSSGFITGDVLSYTAPSGANISGAYNVNTGVLTFTGSATKAQYEELLNSVKFNNLREDVIGGARKVYWTVTDTSGQQSSTAVYSTVSVNRLNDAPVLSDTNLSLGTVQTTSSVVAPTGNVGVLVSSLVGGITDIDGSTAVKGIAVTKINQALGQLYFSVNGGTNWYTYSTAITLSEQAALLLKADVSTRVYFRPHVGVEGTIADAMTIRAWDTSDNRVTLNGAQVTLYNVSSQGGTTAYSVASDTVSLTVASTATPGFVGSSGSDLLDGTTGNDVMVGNGGIDQINAGAGNDKVVLNASNVSTLSAVNTGVINGGTGVNTFKLSGADMLLDLSLAAVQSKVDNFSVLDITGTGNNTLKLNMLNLQTLSGAADNTNTAGANESQMLVVHGDAGDAVILENAASWTVSNSLLGSILSSTYGADYGFITGSPIRKYTQYTKDGVTLFVDDATAVADMVGTSGADVLTGTANADVIYGNGGADQIQAGAGNDVVILNVNSVATLVASNSAVVNGGAGVNSLKLSGFNNTLDLTNATVSGKVDNFSVIDLRQGNGNKIKINLQDVLDLSGAVDNLTTVGVDESRMLVVQGNGGTITNAVQLVDSASWTKVTNLGGTTMINTYGAQYGFEVGRSYTQYTNGLANLFLDQSLGQTLL